ncbi:ribosome maturation factor RimP [Candidatus Bandiella euplotis]|nr:ribosome maturation factor RimP [Candidatus Bandiella woodruffii]
MHFVEKEGYEIVRIRINKSKKSQSCQIMIERSDNQRIDIKDCEKVNKEVVRLLKENDLGLVDCNIEVSSPGIDRPLTRLKDYVASKGKLVRISTLYKVQNRRSFKGRLVDMDDQSIKVRLAGSDDILVLSFESIAEGYLQYEFNKV